MNLVIGEELRKSDVVETAVSDVQFILDKVRNTSLRDYIKQKLAAARGDEWYKVKGKRMGLQTPVSTKWQSHLKSFEFLIKLKRMRMHCVSYISTCMGNML